MGMGMGWSKGWGDSHPRHLHTTSFHSTTTLLCSAVLCSTLLHSPFYLLRPILITRSLYNCRILQTGKTPTTNTYTSPHSFLPSAFCLPYCKTLTFEQLNRIRVRTHNNWPATVTSLLKSVLFLLHSFKFHQHLNKRS